MIKKTEEEIINKWLRNILTPVVSIGCITYNHVDYIAQAIDSFLMQETNFPFEILIHDDASTDGTTEILKKYKERYPNIIRLIIQTENQYSKIPIISPIFVWPKAKGKYIALCEGDDFWSDTGKLQKQVDFLEKNTEYAMYAHAVKIVNDTVLKKPFYPTVKWSKKKNNFIDILNNHFIPTPSLMFRNLLSDFPFVGETLKGLLAGDMAIELFMASKGFCYYDTEVMGIYRNHDDGATKKVIDAEKLFTHWTVLYTTINEYTNFVYKKGVDRKYSEIYLIYAKALWKDNKRLKSFSFFYKFISRSSFYTVIYLMKKIKLSLSK